MREMGTLKAVVQNGRGVIEDLDDYPDGTVLELQLIHDCDELDDEERAKLHKALDRSWAQAQQGKKGRPIDEILKDL